jgi:lysophospholipase L1-like esterase
MDRRLATSWIASVMLAGCGGGGGGGSSVAETPPAGSTSALALGPASAPPPPAPTPAPPPPPAIPPPTTRNVALWGDSMTPPTARALQLLFAGQREVFDGGVAGETSGQISARQAADTTHRDWITVFWYGHNDIRIDTPTAAERVKAELAASIARLTPGNNRYVVLSLANNASEARRGSGQYQAVIQLNNDLAALYPQNYLDIRAFMVSQYDPANGQQAQEFQDDVPSSSLRFDDIHLTGFGADVVARRIREYFQSKGW